MDLEKLYIPAVMKEQPKDYQRARAAHAMRLKQLVGQGNVTHWLIDNVAQYYLQTEFDKTKGEMLLHIRNLLTRIAPPHELIMFRYDGAKFIRGMAKIENVAAEIPAWMNTHVVIGSILTQEKRKDGWTIVITTSRGFRTKGKWWASYGPSVTIDVARDGEPLWDTANITVGEMAAQAMAEAQENEEADQEKLTELSVSAYNSDILTIAPALLALNFANCRNVELVEEPMSRQVRRRKERKGEQIYKVLKITPFGKKYEGEGRFTGMHNKLHICRGHFRTYTEDAPLFGKVTGTFWIEQHVRGSKEVGEVIKDYEIVAE